MLYNSLSDEIKKQIISEDYINNGMSFAEIAKKYSTYSNKVRRDALKFGITIRNKSEAQKNVLLQGKSKHPTKGKQRTQEEKNKIGLGIYNSWLTLSEQELEKRKQRAKKVWDNLSEDEKSNRLNAAHAAIRATGKTGSKLEKFLLTELLANGYKVEFHKEQILSNTKLQIDIYLPELTTAIEVDGPSHFEPVWGQDTLNKNQKYDQKKNGLIIGKGMKLIRIKQTKDFSSTRAKIIFGKLDAVLNNISISGSDKIFYIED